MNLTNDELSRWIAETIEPEPADLAGVPDGIAKLHYSPKYAWVASWYKGVWKTWYCDWQPRDMCDDPAATVMLQANLIVAKGTHTALIAIAERHHMIACSEDGNPDMTHEQILGRATAEVFALENGYGEKREPREGQG